MLERTGGLLSRSGRTMFVSASNSRGTMTLIKHALVEHKIHDPKLDPSSQALTLSDVRTPGAPLVYVNKGFEKMTGYERKDVIGRNCRFLQGPHTSPDSVARMRAASSPVLTSQSLATGEWTRSSDVPLGESSTTSPSS